MWPPDIICQEYSAFNKFIVKFSIVSPEEGAMVLW